jgi:hypothetical protein
MDERLEKALEFANYRITLGNQKRTLKKRTLVLQTVHYAKGVFQANPTTIAFVKTLIDLDKEDAIIVDTKENPIHIEDLEEFLETLVSAYTEASNAYKVQAEKIKKARNIKSLMDW